MILIELLKRIEFSILCMLGIIHFGSIGKKSLVKYGMFGGSKNINIGDYVYIGDNGSYWGEGGIKISNGTIIGPRVTIRSTNHNYKESEFLPYDKKVIKKPVIIGENCWIGDSVMIAPGTVIGEGSIVGMGSVLSGKYEAHSLIVGNPGKTVKNIHSSTYEQKKKDGLIYLKYKNNSLLARLKKVL